MTGKTARFFTALLDAVRHRDDVRRIVNNVGWLLFDRIVRLGVGLVVGVWIARYLGPQPFGVMSYALAFVGLLSSVATLSLGEIVVRDLVREPGTTGATMGSALALQAIGGAVAFGVTLLAIGYARPDDEISRSAVTILAMLLLVKAVDVVRYWFESKLQSRYVVWTETGVALLFAAAKVTLILLHAPLMAFIWALLAEGLIGAAGLLAIFAMRGGGMRAWHIRPQRVKTLLADSWPLMLSGMAIMVYMRIDQIMLGQLLGDESVGIYTAAVKISEIVYFIPMSIAASAFPAIVEVRKRDEALYYRRLQRLYDLMVALSLAVALPVTFLSDWMVTFLFGSAYRAAGPVLAIHIWAGVFVFLGVAGAKWYIVENLQKISLLNTSLGAAANIVLNYIFIPRWGVAGAAWATVVSYAIVAYLCDSFNAKTRVVFFMKSKSLFFHSRFGGASK
jgi:O-antigen/teichoic acid export membrane protein